MTDPRPSNLRSADLHRSKQRCRPVSVAAVFFLLLASAIGGVPVKENLLINGDFEADLANWTLSPGAISTVSYGAVGAPDSQVRDKISGNNKLARAVGGSGGSKYIEQTCPLPPRSGGMYLHAGGFFGGVGSKIDRARLIIEFPNAGSAQESPVYCDYVSASQRNFEDVLLIREQYILIDATASQVKARIEFEDTSSQSLGALVDNIFMEIVASQPAPVHADGVELLVNGGFESVWSTYNAASQGYSPLALNGQGWEGDGVWPAIVRPYTAPEFQTLNDPADPAFPIGMTVSMNGGTYLLAHKAPQDGTPVDVALRQRIDIRGDTLAGFANRSLRVSASLGGVQGSLAKPEIFIRFLGANLGMPQDTSVESEHLLGPVLEVDRNLESALLMRERFLDVPSDAAYVDVRVLFFDNKYINFGKYFKTGLVDNVSVKFVPKPGHPTISFGSNLVKNGSFDSSSAIPGSPLTMGDAQGWEGASDANTATKTSLYGGLGAVLSNFSAAKGLGPRVATYSSNDSGTCSLRQRIDLRGTAFLTGKFTATASAWLRPGSLPNDKSEVRIRFIGESGLSDIALPEFLAITGASFPSAGTLLLVKRTFPIPVGTRELWVEARMVKTFYSSSAASGFVDKVNLTVKCEGGCASPNSKGCDKSKTIATGTYMLRVFKAHAAYVGAAPAAQSVDALNAALANALTKLATALGKASEKASNQGNLCTYVDSAADLAISPMTASNAIYDEVAAGLAVESKADRKLRATLLLRIGKYFKSALSAEAANMAKPNEIKLSTARAKLRAKFVASATKAIESAEAKGTLYAGALPSDLADQSDQEIAALVNTLH